MLLQCVCVCVCVCRMCYLSGHYSHQPVVSAAGQQVGDVDQSLRWKRNTKVTYSPASQWMMSEPHAC